MDQQSTGGDRNRNRNSNSNQWLQKLHICDKIATAPMASSSQAMSPKYSTIKAKCNHRALPMTANESSCVTGKSSPNIISFSSPSGCSSSSPTRSIRSPPLWSFRRLIVISNKNAINTATHMWWCHSRLSHSTVMSAFNCVGSHCCKRQLCSQEIKSKRCPECPSFGTCLWMMTILMKSAKVNNAQKDCVLFGVARSRKRMWLMMVMKVVFPLQQHQ